MDQRTILRLVAEVPDRDGFPLVDDLHARFDALAAAHPERVTVTRIGTSRLGEPLHAYRIGSGSHAAVIVGGVHPNEPIGSWTALHLATWLLDDPETSATLDTTWHIVPTIDPDGMRLNEAWFHHPHDRVFYSRHFYRPAPDSQVEWTFPNQYRSVYFDQVLPETLAFMRLIDDTRPDLLVSLHNGEMGGVYYYLSEDLPDVVDTLHAVPAALGLPLDTGEPESPYLRELAPRCSRWTASRPRTTTSRASASSPASTSTGRPARPGRCGTARCAWSPSCRTGAIRTPMTRPRRRSPTRTCSAGARTTSARRGSSCRRSSTRRRRCSPSRHRSSRVPAPSSRCSCPCRRPTARVPTGSRPTGWPPSPNASGARTWSAASGSGTAACCSGRSRRRPGPARRPRRSGGSAAGSPSGTRPGRRTRPRARNRSRSASW
ncbi:M14 family zinc carboxypeptidase [Curtobacterium flaccumfaciens]|nr:M14 family zinc carboxypeptidase [Curtobacterium flaccumfaciens]